MKRISINVMLLAILFCSCATAQSYDGSGAAIAQESSGQSEASTYSETTTSTDSDSGSSGEDSDSGTSQGSASDTATSRGDGDLKNLEALVSIIGAFAMGTGVVTAISLLASGVIVMIKRETKKWLGGILIGWSVFALIGGIMTPGVLNWFMASAKDARLFE